VRRPTDQVLRGLKGMADAFDVALDRPPFSDLHPQTKRDVRAAVRWCWRMNNVREDRAEVRRLRVLRGGWSPELPLPPYAPARRKKPARG
jgi:hypothetical protein